MLQFTVCKYSAGSPKECGEPPQRRLLAFDSALFAKAYCLFCLILVDGSKSLWITERNMHVWCMWKPTEGRGPLVREAAMAANVFPTE